MPMSSVAYSALSQNEDDEDIYKGDEIQFGSEAGTFDSIFTYAKYNDLDRMGYQVPKRFGNEMSRRNRPFTYSKQFNNDDIEVRPMNTIELIIYGVSILLVALTLPFSLLFVTKFVSTSEKLVILRLGRAQKTRGPGATFVLPCIDSTHKVNTSLTAFNVPPLQVITIDRGLVELGATVFLRVRDPVSAVCGIQDRNNSTRTLANTMLYRYVSKKRICELTSGKDRSILAATMKDELAQFTSTFGVQVTEVELSEMKIMKDGEDMGMAALNAVASSETGQMLWQTIGPHLTEITKEYAAEKKNARVEAMNDSARDDDNNDECDHHYLDPQTTSRDSLIDLSPGLDVDNLVTVINMAIDEHLTQAIGKVYQVNCEGMDSLYIDLKNGSGHCGKGYAPYPDVVFETSQLTFFQIIKQTIAPVNAYMDGSLKIKGAVRDALSLRYLAERVAPLL